MRYKHILLLIVLMYLLFNQSRGANIDSLKYVAENSKIDTAKYNALFKLAVAHIDTDFDASKMYWSLALELASHKRLWNLAADAYHQLGYILQKKGDLKAALQNLIAAQSIYEQQNNKISQAEVLNDIGLIYRSWARYDLAIENFSLALNIFKAQGHVEGIGMVSNNIGQIFFYRQEYLKAIEFFKTYLEINQKSNYHRAVAAASNNIASAYMELNSFDLAHSYYVRALHIYDSLSISIGVAIIQDNIGTLFLKKGMFVDALLYHTNAVERFQKLGSSTRECIALKNIGIAYFYKNDVIKAIEYLNKSLKIANRENIIETKQELLYHLALVNEKMNSYKKAFEYFKEFSSIKDSLQKQEAEEKLKLLENQIMDDELKTELNKLIKEKEGLLDITNYLIISSILILIVSLCLLLYIYLLRKKRGSSSILNKDFYEYQQSLFYGTLHNSFNVGQIKCSRNCIPHGHGGFIYENETMSCLIVYNIHNFDIKFHNEIKINTIIYNKINDSLSHIINPGELFSETLQFVTKSLNTSYTFKSLIYNKKDMRFEYFGSESALVVTPTGDVIEVENGFATEEQLGMIIIENSLLNFKKNSILKQDIIKAIESLPQTELSRVDQLISGVFDLNDATHGDIFSAFLVTIKLRSK